MFINNNYIIENKVKQVGTPNTIGVDVWDTYMLYKIYNYFNINYFHKLNILYVFSIKTKSSFVLKITEQLIKVIFTDIVTIDG